MRENTAATNKSVDYVKPAHAINKHKAGAKPKAKNYSTDDSSTTTRIPTHASGAAVVDTIAGTALRGRPFEEIVRGKDIFTLCVGVNKC